MKLSSQNLLLRIAIAFAFLYAATDSFLEPDSWVTFFPSFLFTFAPETTLLYAWSVVEIVLALWILSGKKIFLPSLTATLALLGIVVFNLPLFQIVFRDLALACVSASLALGSLPAKSGA